jgi:hypothetical protein
MNLLSGLNPVVTETEWDRIGWSPLVMGALGPLELSSIFQQFRLV